MNKQLSLFTLAPASQIKAIHDPYWDEVEEIAPTTQAQPVAVGSRVKISLEWLDKCCSAVDKRYHKYYQHKSNHPLICKVIEVHDSGGIYIARGGNALYVPSGYFEIAHQHSEQNLETHSLTTPCNFVGEQVNNDTQKPAHQHDTHWIERYWVERGANKYWYYRYAWMDGRKIRRIYIGSVSSALAKNRKAAVEAAIIDGLSPLEIGQLIHRQPSS